MDTPDLIASLAERLREHQVFGPPVERGEVTVVPVAEVRGGGGIGGRGRLDKGGNGGFGLIAKPVGAWVIANGKVSWQPCVDVNRAVLSGTVVTASALFVLRQLLRTRAQAGR